MPISISKQNRNHHLSEVLLLTYPQLIYL